MRVSATVTNTGQRGGREVVQVYVTDPQCSVFRPEAELKGCAVVSLEPGQSGRVDISLDARAFSFWHPTLGRWVIEGGRFGIRVGSSSRDIRLTTEGEPAGSPASSPSVVSRMSRDDEPTRMPKRPPSITQRPRVGCQNENARASSEMSTRPDCPGSSETTAQPFSSASGRNTEHCGSVTYTWTTSRPPRCPVL